MTHKILGAGIIFALAASFAHAAPAVCDLKNAAHDLELLKNNASAVSGGLRTELELRRGLIMKMTECLIQEAVTAQQEAGTIDVRSSAAREVQSQQRARLQESIDYYRSLQTTVAELGIRGTQDTARKLREWHTTSFRAGAELAANFAIWSKNETLFTTASDRLNQVQVTMHALKLVGNDEIEGYFEAAQTSFHEGRVLQNEALGLLRRAGPSDATVAKIKASVAKLSETYATLLDLSNTVARLTVAR